MNVDYCSDVVPRRSHNARSFTSAVMQNDYCRWDILATCFQTQRRLATFVLGLLQTGEIGQDSGPTDESAMTCNFRTEAGVAIKGVHLIPAYFSTFALTARIYAHYYFGYSDTSTSNTHTNMGQCESRRYINASIAA